MAVDTKQKRQSALNFLRAFSPRLLFPDGAIDQGDRQASLISYSGILATAIPLWVAARAAPGTWSNAGGASGAWVGRPGADTIWEKTRDT